MRFAVPLALALGILCLRSGEPWMGWPVLLAAAALALWRTPAGIEPEPPAGPPQRWEVIALLLLVLAGAALRLPALTTMPPGCWFDEAENGLETNHLLDGELRFYTPRNNGRGALQFWWTAPFFAALGASTASLRLATAVLGVLTIPLAWLVLRRLGGRAAGLLGAGFLAVSGWHVTVSRIAFDVVMTPLFDLAAVGAAWEAARSGSRRFGAAAGAAAALANYGYTASRLTPLLVLAAFLLAPGPRRTRPRVLAAAWSVAAFLLLIAPLSLYAATHLKAFTYRAKQVTIRSEMRDTGSTLGPVLHSSVATARMLHEHGDDNARHNRPGRPMLEAATGLCFLLGVTWGRRAAPGGAFPLALVWLGLPLLVGGMLTIRAPHGNRTVAALVPSCLLAAWGARAAAEAWRLRARPALATLLLASAAIPSAYDYFVRYPRTPDLEERFATGADAVGKWVRAHPELRGLRVHNDFNASVVRFVSGRDDLVFLRPKEMKAAAAPGLYLAPSPESVGGRHLRVTRIAGAWNQRFTLIEVAAQEAGGGDGTPLRYISGENQNRVTFPSPSIQN